MKPDFISLKRQIESLHRAISAKITERQTITAEIDAVNSAPPDRQAVVDLLHSYVDEQAAKYPATLKDLTQGFIKNWRKGDLLKTQGLALTHIVRDLNGQLDISLRPDGLFYLLQQPLKEALARAVAAMELPSEGMDTATRWARLQSLQERLQAVDTELTELYDQCQGFGIALPDGTLPADEKEIRRRAELAALQKPSKVEVLTNPWPGDKDYRGPRAAAAAPRSSAYEANDLPEDAFKLNHA